MGACPERRLTVNRVCLSPRTSDRPQLRNRGCAENEAVVALRLLRRFAEAPERWAAAARAVRRAPSSASSRRAASSAGTASASRTPAAAQHRAAAQLLSA